MKFFSFFPSNSIKTVCCHNCGYYDDTFGCERYANLCEFEVPGENVLRVQRIARARNVVLKHMRYDVDRIAIVDLDLDIENPIEYAHWQWNKVMTFKGGYNDYYGTFNFRQRIGICFPCNCFPVCNDVFHTTMR